MRPRGRSRTRESSGPVRVRVAGSQSGRFALVVVPRLIAQLLQTAGVEGTSGRPVGGTVWQSTRLILLILDEVGISAGTELMTGRPLAWTGGQLALKLRVAEFPRIRASGEGGVVAASARILGNSATVARNAQLQSQLAVAELLSEVPVALVTDLLS